MGENTKRKFTSVVNKSLQYRFLAMMIIYFVILILFLGFTLFLPDMIQMRNEDLSMAVRVAAADRMLLKHAWVWPIVLIISVLMGLHSFRSFHKVAGPLYRFKWAFEQIQNGNFGLVVKIRKKDYLHAEETSLNNMLRVLESRMETVMKGSRNALQSFEQIEKKMKESNSLNQDQEDQLHLHRQCLNEINEALGYFKLGDNIKEDT